MFIVKRESFGHKQEFNLDAPGDIALFRKILPREEIAPEDAISALRDGLTLEYGAGQGADPTDFVRYTPLTPVAKVCAVPTPPQCIVLVGNPVDGLKGYGPFDQSGTEVDQFVEDQFDSCWILNLVGTVKK